MIRKMKIILRQFLVIAVLVYGTGCGKKQSVRESFVIDGQTGVVMVAESNVHELNTAVDIVSKSIKATIAVLDEKNDKNELAKLNRVGGSSRLPLSRTVFRALDMGRAYGEITGGAYDYTMAGVAELWQMKKPDSESLDNALEHAGIKYVEAADNGSITLTSPGVVITPGLLTHAYALDVGIIEIRRTIRGPYFVQYGYFARTGRAMPEKETPKIPIVVPDRKSGKTIGEVKLSTYPAMAALPRQQTAFVRTNAPARIIIDPRTGHPASGTRLAVVIGPLTTKAYALAEALLVLGLEDGKNIMTNFPGYEAMLVPDKKRLECWMTPAFREQFIPAENMESAITLWTIENPEVPSANGL
jgi:FAD:protein FMN transferase